MTAGRLTGKVALITGSDSGIGQATAVEFAREGADIVVHYLHDEQGAAGTKAAVEAAGQRALVTQADIGDEAQVAAMFDAALEYFGTLDILMNNAGVDASGTPVADLSNQVWDRAIRTNVYGTFFCCRRFIQHRLATGGAGKIINVTSVHADNPNAGGADYDCSKGAARMLTRTLALELASHRINVNSLTPGMVLTPFNQAAIDDPALLASKCRASRGNGPPSPPRSRGSPSFWPPPTPTTSPERPTYGRRPDDQPGAGSLSGPSDRRRASEVPPQFMCARPRQAV